MKILKRVGIVILVLLLIYIVFAFFCRADIHVERATVINADRNAVFNHVNTLTEWKSWSYWDNIDSNMKSTFEGPASGVGAIHHWTSENDSVGHGSLKITQSIPGSFVETELTFGDMPPSLGGWKFADTTGGVKASTYMDIHVPFLFRPMMALMNMDKALGDDFAKSLDGLKKLSEQEPKKPAINVEEVTVGPMKILTIADSCTFQDIGMKLGQLYGEMGAVAKKGGAKQAGPVFAFYDKTVFGDHGPEKFWIRAGVPIDKEVKSSGRVVYSEMPAGNAVKGDHYGSYDSMQPTYDALNAYIKDHNKTVTGSPWETYVTDPMAEKDSTKWLTEIYFPVK